jgi:ethanolamine utilization protein EutJ
VTTATTVDIDALLVRTAEVMRTGGDPAGSGTGALRAGVDLGTAYTVVVAVDETGWPVAGACEYAQVVRDGVVVDFRGAVGLLRRLTQQVQQRLGRPLAHAASGFPPGVRPAEVRAVGYVLAEAGLECSALTDEPTAANAVLGVRDGAVIDIGGGTTGVAVFAGGRLVRVTDEPTGGTQVTLVIAGGLGIPFAEAERRKCDPAQAAKLAGRVRPVFEKIGTIVAGAVAGHGVQRLHLVGGTSRFPGIAGVIGAVTGLPATVPVDPMFVTALGLAYHDRPDRPGAR